MARSVDDWMKALRSLPSGLNEVDTFKYILNSIDGYAIEYGIDMDDDAQDLLNAFIAWKQIPS